MRLGFPLIPATLLTGIAFLAMSAPLHSQQPSSAPAAIAAVDLPEAPEPQVALSQAEPADQQAPAPQSTAPQTPAQQTPAPQTSPSQAPASPAPASPAPPQALTSKTPESGPASEHQPKRILGLMPNYRAVSAGAIPPPPTPREAFIIATQNTFDYSAFSFVAITTLMAEGSNTHPTLGKGLPGFGRYYWRGFIDKTTGDYMVIFVLPTVFHQDERYFAKGQGSIFSRGIYSASRVLITPNYHGRNVFNAPEVFGRAIAQGISVAYYPPEDRTISTLASKYAYSLGRDAAINIIREFWPDFSTHVLHRHP